MLDNPGAAAAGWGDAATLVPWVVYQRSGDLGLLARQLPSMRAWVDRAAALAGDDHLWTGGFQFGDWLDPTAPPDAAAEAKADPDVVATAHLARSAEVVSLAATLVGELDIADRYARLADRVRGAFAREYVTVGGRVLSDAATVYALALEWSLLPTEEQRRHAGERLADLVRTAGFRISTGFLGTPLIADALTSTGHADVAYRLLLQTGCPSWLYAGDDGRHDGVGALGQPARRRLDQPRRDDVVQPLRARRRGRLAAPDGRRARTRRARLPPAGRQAGAVALPDLRRRPGCGRRTATPRSAWERADGLLELRVTVPVGAGAVVHVPGRSEPIEVRHGTYEWHVPDVWATNGAPLSTVRDVLDDEHAWNDIVAAAKELSLVSGERQAAGRLKGYLDAPAATLIDALIPPGLVRNGDALRARLTEVFEGGDPA